MCLAATLKAANHKPVSSDHTKINAWVNKEKKSSRAPVSLWNKVNLKKKKGFSFHRIFLCKKGTSSGYLMMQFCSLHGKKKKVELMEKNCL